MVVHPDAREALVIGLGGGATAGALSQHAGVSVDVVELSPEVAQAAARFFRPINFDVLRKPNVRLHIDDGRNYLLLTGKRYDVVTADVILPIHAGSGNLYSAEYFRLVRRALKPGGIAVQWVAGTEAEYKTIMRTFLSVFPHTTLWAGGSLMLGSVEPLRLRKSDFDWKLQVPERREMIARLGVTTLRGSAPYLRRRARRDAPVSGRGSCPDRRSPAGGVFPVAAARPRGGSDGPEGRRHAPRGAAVKARRRRCWVRPSTRP